MILDRPVWNSLTTRHAAVSVGGERARRFASDIGPLAGLRDDDPASFAELAALGSVIVIQADRKTPHEAVIRVMEAAHRLGYTHLTFATQAPSSEP